MTSRGAIALAVTAVLSLSAGALEVRGQEGAASQSYTTYVVKWYETLDDVAARFSVSKEVLMAFNGLTTEKLSRRQELRIPSDPDAVLRTPPAGEEPATVQPADSTAVSDGVQDDEDTGGPVVYSSKVRAGLLLPLKASSGTPDRNTYDFYCGALLAMRDLSDEGLDVRAEVLDYPSERMSLVDMASADVIIGPIAPAQIDSLLRHMPESTPVISPLDPKGLELAARHTNLIQAPAPSYAQYDAVIEWLREDLQPQDRVLLLREKDTTPTPLAERLATSGLTYSTLSYGILEGRGAISGIEKLMTSDGVNRVLIASDNEAFVNDAVRNINLMKFRDYDVTLYSTSRIRNFETIEVESLHNVHARVVCTYFVDYTADAVKKFLMRYRALFGCEPSPFAFQGYDTARYFLREFATTESRRARMRRLSAERWRGLQADFQLAECTPASAATDDSGQQDIDTTAPGTETSPAVAQGTADSTSVLSQIFPGLWGRRSHCGYTNTAVRRILYSDGYQVILL